LAMCTSGLALDRVHIHLCLHKIYAMLPSLLAALYGSNKHDLLSDSEFKQLAELQNTDIQRSDTAYV